MNATAQVNSCSPYTYFLRVLAFLAEQKIATAKQIAAYCFFDASESLHWKVLKKLRSARLIEAKVIKPDERRQHFAFSLTKDGLKELKDQGYLDIEDFQIKTNSPYHDIILGDLRITFSKMSECNLFIPENIIHSKILEEELKDINIFRSHRSDAAVLLNINGDKTWLAVEYERNQKARQRYEQKIKNWYQAENLDGVLLIAESTALIQQMIKIDCKTLPHLPRKILYLPLSNTKSTITELKFINCQNKSLTFKIGDFIKTEYPILNQNLTNFQTTS